VLTDLQRDLADVLTALDDVAHGPSAQGVHTVVDLLERGIAGLAQIPNRPVHHSPQGAMS
jgi:prephenate dehydrogenase